MKFFIVDDHVQIIRVLENIIEDHELGEVVGYALDGIEAVDDILLKKPDIVLIDFLMPGFDGPKVVEMIKDQVPAVKFIMISQVATKSLIEKAYGSGIEFFIAKPINHIEVLRVIGNVQERIEMQRKFDVLKHLFQDDQPTSHFAMDSEEQELNKIRIIFSKIGIMGEKGGEDILTICKYMIEYGKRSHLLKINDICLELSDNPKAMEQRIRRAINKGLVNLANLGIEDYMNDTFMRFSSTLYDFESVKAEMDFIRGQRSSGGKISVKKFIDNLLLHKDL